MLAEEEVHLATACDLRRKMQAVGGPSTQPSYTERPVACKEAGSPPAICAQSLAFRPLPFALPSAFWSFAFKVSKALQVIQFAIWFVCTLDLLKGICKADGGLEFSLGVLDILQH